MFADWDEMEHCLHMSGVDADTIASIREVCNLSGVTPQEVGGFSQEELVEQLFLTEKEASAVMAAATGLHTGLILTPTGLEVIPESRETQDSLPEATPLSEDEMESKDPHPQAAHEANFRRHLEPVPSAHSPVSSPRPIAGGDGMRLTQSAAFNSDDLESTGALGVLASPRRCAEPFFLRKSASARTPDSPTAPSPLRKSTSATKRASASSTLHAPTAAFLSRVAGARDSKVDGGLDPGYKNLRSSFTAVGAGCLGRFTSTPVGLSKSMSLSFGLSALPAGQRYTKAQPFSFRESSRHAQVLSTEEKDLLEGKKQFKSHTVPKHLHEARPLELSRSPKSKPKNPQDLFKPFNLSTEVRHEKSVEKSADKLRLEAQGHVFKATPLDKRIFDKVDSPGAKPTSPASAKKVTVGKAPTFRSEERVMHHKIMSSMQGKKSSMSQLEKEMMEERLRETEAAEKAARAKQEEKEKERMYKEKSADELRKMMVFKARAMPDFNKRMPFRPAPSPRDVTRSVEFNLTTDSRLGKALSVSERADASPPLSVLARDFSRSLRGPLSASSSPPRGGSHSVCLRTGNASSKAAAGGVRKSHCSVSLATGEVMGASGSPNADLKKALGAALEAAALSPRTGGAPREQQVISSPRFAAVM